MFSKNIMTEGTPKVIFVVPYRDRVKQQTFFRKHMHYILEDTPKEDYKIYFVHQKDTRGFNRGAMKNIGFLAMKDKYPDTYKNITFVFNDVDTMPMVKDEFVYATKPGIIKHFYGFRYALGGIVSITGEDFERINGFPNFWGWGYEDNVFQTRAEKNNIVIDRSKFYPLLDKNVIHLQDGFIRIVNDKEAKRYHWGTHEGFRDIRGLTYDVEDDMVNVTAFESATVEQKASTRPYDMKSKKNPFSKRAAKAMKMHMV